MLARDGVRGNQVHEKIKFIGIVTFVTSTNLDGLHIASGIPEDKLAELHGNSFKEICEQCKASFHRKFDCTAQGTRSDHWTGRYCEHCNGKLRDTIINFGENLPENEFKKAYQNSTCDLALVLGTSMRVQPSCSLPERAIKSGGSLVISNLQYTPYDAKAILLPRGKTDTLMKLLLAELGIEIPTTTPDGRKIKDTTTNWEREHLLGIEKIKLKKLRENKPTNTLDSMQHG